MEPSRATRRRCLVPEHLWYLGDLRIQGTHAFAPVFLGRLFVAAPAGAIHRALSDPIFERAGMVLILSSTDLPLPNGHQLRPIEHLLIPGRDGEKLDLAAVDRVLRGLPAGTGTEPDAWFDYRTGRLMLPHFDHAEKLAGIRLEIIKVFWNASRGAQLEWKNLKIRVNSAAKTIDDAFHGKANRAYFLEKSARGRYRLRRA